ncbi:hypothetical protein PHSY_006673 [Pseudozyma hubeiensis SY62]|uniref:Uncharacterized protein n=1 Tax=Pseudozyma hubeiensis (strain SY62) TaxID=1305764 RepID=R9PCH8_PSEHS|nr:hypothetical protein PHSY_006673 [Pseudozyma hubeiensis SY62]GAC99076.1 hypothetical protein PHSY_006673 [Pseudozyma hubeiensis SY62]
MRAGRISATVMMMEVRVGKLEIECVQRAVKVSKAIRNASRSLTGLSYGTTCILGYSNSTVIRKPCSWRSWTNFNTTHPIGSLFHIQPHSGLIVQRRIFNSADLVDTQATRERERNMIIFERGGRTKKKRSRK